jgi:hypothetical protein
MTQTLTAQVAHSKARSIYKNNASENRSILTELI